jgi:hypothetical protein
MSPLRGWWSVGASQPGTHVPGYTMTPPDGGSALSPANRSGNLVDEIDGDLLGLGGLLK